jgi:FSR family fosmidomycin resistance protein-like MFS transporter
MKNKLGKLSYILFMGHTSCDINQGALPALLPFLVLEHGFSYASAAGLVFASNLVSSIVQPLFGHLGDKVEKPQLMCVGLFMAGGGISLMGFLTNYWALFFAAMFTGVGVALFHPEGSKLATIVAGEHKGAGMSIFAVGGNAGFAIGPILASGLMLWLGLKGTFVFALLGVAATLVMATQLRALKAANAAHREERKEEAERGEAKKDNWPAFTMVSLSMFCRCIISSCLITFLPLFWVSVLMQSVAQGNLQLTIESLAGALATLAGGRLADRFGYRRLAMFCTIAVPPFFFLFAFNRVPLLGTLLLIVIAVLMSACQSPFVLLGQSFLPNRIGFASGVMYGLTVSVGGMVAPLIGRVGDLYGLQTSVLVLAFISIAGLLFSAFMPRSPLDKAQQKPAAP